MLSLAESILIFEGGKAVNYLIDLPKPVGAVVEQEAQKAGVSPSELLADVVRKSFGPMIDPNEQARLNAPSVALLDFWLAEAVKPRTPEEQAEADVDMEDLMRSLNATRRESGGRLLFLDVNEKR